MQNITNGENTERNDQEIFGLKEIIVEGTQKRQLILYGHVRRKGEVRTPKAELECIHQEERKRPETLSIYIVRRAMGDRTFQDEHFQDGVRWRKILQSGQDRKKL
jgi:hypothetical protein